MKFIVVVEIPCARPKAACIEKRGYPPEGLLKRTVESGSDFIALKYS